jgi:hypothetical protein
MPKKISIGVVMIVLLSLYLCYDSGNEEVFYKGLRK